VGTRSDRLIPAVRGLIVLAGAAAAGWTVNGLQMSGDYQVHGLVSGDNAGPALDALVHGQPAAMASVQPLMGLVSILWRAPFAGAAVWLGGSDQLVYQFGVAACLLPLAALLVWLVGRAASPAQLGAAVLAVAVIVVGPATTQALRLGHPEELLATVLATGAVLAAGQDRRLWASALLGMAIGTKPWAVLAVPCVLLALPPSRAALVAVAVGAAAVAAPTVALLPLSDMTSFRAAKKIVGGFTATNPLSLWWPVSPSTDGGPVVHTLPLALTRSGAAAAAFSFAFGAIWIYARRVGGGRRPAVDGLALLALVGLVRCLGDPTPVTYYLLPVVIPLALWEAGVQKRLPIWAALVSIALAVLPRYLALVAPRHGHGAIGVAVLSAAWLAGAGALAVRLLRHAFRDAATAGAGGASDQGWRGTSPPAAAPSR
jgi:hypothetical protein